MQSNKTSLLVANTLLVFFLVVLNNFGVIPLRTSDFIFFTLLALALALYRPGWAFLFFTGTIVLENINLVSVEWGITIRPFQLLGAVTVLALIIRMILKRINFKLAKLKWPDYLLILLIISGFLSILNAPDKVYSLKLALILATFFILYLLTRNYVQNADDLKKITPFFLSSAVIVVLYGIWQNWRFMRDLPNFEAMPGRPNATFTEADWLGMFLVLVISVIYALIYYKSVIARDPVPLSGRDRGNLVLISELLPASPTGGRFARNDITFYLFLTLLYILLILTVSRSAWLGAIAALIIFLLIVFTDLKLSSRNWQWRKTFHTKIFIFSALAVGVIVVCVFNLTNFQLFNRVQSVGTGMQKITVSCEEDKELPEFIDAVGELKEFSCRHVNLEEIQSEIEKGNFVKEIYRKDPNVFARRDIYQKSWEQIKAHPILGIGWGSISSVLGTDERGVRLNSSNIFLEVWLGAGLIGLLSFAAFWLYIISSVVKKFMSAVDTTQKAFSLFLILGWLGLSVVNLFNAGLFLGFFWFFLALAI